MKRFRSRQSNFDENNSNYLRRNWRRLGRNLSFADERFYFRQPQYDKMNIVSIILLLFFSFLNFNIQQEKSILFIGDSFTAGDGIDKEFKFTTLIDKKLSNAVSINQGRSGWATSSYLRRWEEVESAFPQKADVIFIQLGGNDLRVDGHSKSTILQCKKNMGEILERLEAHFPKSEIVLMSSVKIDENKLVPKIKEAGFGKHSNKYLRKIGKSYQQLAKENGYGYLDLIAKLPINNTHDGAHLNKEGHSIVAKSILGYLQKENGSD